MVGAESGAWTFTDLKRILGGGPAGPVERRLLRGNLGNDGFSLIDAHRVLGGMVSGTPALVLFVHRCSFRTRRSES